VFNLIIAISGLHGTGKTTIAKRISEIFNLKHYSTGFMFRDLAKEKNLTIEELSKLAEEDSSIDYALDEKIKQYTNEGNCVLDNQLSPYLLGDQIDYCVLLKCAKDVRIKRMMERDSDDFEKKLYETELRELSEQKRFLKYYGVDVLDSNTIMSTFDLILDTTYLDIEGAVNIIKTAIEEFIRTKKDSKNSN